MNHGRRALLGSLAAAGLTPLGTWAQAPKSAAGARGPAIAQIADFSAAQIDISKDFVLGVRAAVQDFNLKGGLRGKPLQHQVIEVDSSAASIKAAVQSIKADSQVVAMVGTVGSTAASQVADLLVRDLPDVAHVAPWLQSNRSDSGDNTFTIFASRQEQITFALKSLAVMGVQEIGAVYATQSELSQYRSEIEQVARNLKLSCKHVGPAVDLQQLGRTLTSTSPRILVFLGGTPELAQFTLGIDKQASQRYIVAMSDVNLQTLQQMGMSRHAPVIATQVVPLTNAGLPVVKSYRDTLNRLFDEAPTPQSLAGFVAARYCFDVLRTVEANPTRSTVLAAFQQRNAVELGGFKADPDSKRRGSAYVTQSMIASDGRIVG